MNLIKYFMEKMKYFMEKMNCLMENMKYFMEKMKFYGQDKYFMEWMKYLNKGRNNNFQTCRTVRGTLTVKKHSKNVQKGCKSSEWVQVSMSELEWV